MNTHTQQERLLAAIEARGEKLIKTTAKYRVMTRTKTLQGVPIPPTAKPSFYYVGQAGAVRIGTTITESRPMLPISKAQLLNEGAALLGG